MNIKRKIAFSLVIGAAVAASIPLVAAFEAHIISVMAQIESRLFLNPIPDIDFGTAFPQEKFDKGFTVTLASTFLNDPTLDDLEYVLRQKPKCQADDPTAPIQHPPVTEDGQGNFVCPQGSTEMPLLCPYLSKSEETGDGTEGENDGATIPPFHGLPGPWTLQTTLAYQTVGRLIKSGQDTADEWNIDLKVPCFRGQCAQDWPAFVSTESGSTTITASNYEADPANESKLWGCDLWLEVTATSAPPGGGCTEQLDLMLVLDRSGSIDSTELQTLKNAANAFVTALGPSAGGVHIGQTSFSTTGTLDLHLTDVEADVHTAINALVSGGFTNLKEGIELATGELDNAHVHERPAIPDVMVVITDGAPNRPTSIAVATSTAAAAADAARAASIEIFVVGVGVSSSTETYLKADIADSPAHYFPAGDFDDLQAILEDLPVCQ
ncbi:MAG: VWA domain-containing protein [Candidatus Sungbacteria bacterium]|uniref:VWA domain-containing protein n=1 Tax=Candidatus Sungiibacteriota bacterium TaxID=2750080 RepID=A0A932YYM6_9BACT|nr:VWA domain-containing protein [Candidatus Sungbacteria bacterium]